MSILDHKSFYLVGIKGVAMAALAQCLVDAGKQVTGCDTAENFVTQPILDSLSISIDVGFNHNLDQNPDCIIYTAAHQGLKNPIVTYALAHNIPVISYAEAIADLANQKSGVAVCGVGGKSTVTAMIVWILEWVLTHGEQFPDQSKQLLPSYMVGVGDIATIHRTGKWNSSGKYFVIEADEYVADPTAPLRGEPLVPKFHFLTPQIIICTNIHFDHPDVFQDINQTRQAFLTFFRKILPQGTLIYNSQDPEVVDLVRKLIEERPDVEAIGYGWQDSQVSLSQFTSSPGNTRAVIKVNQDEPVNLELRIPGKFNLSNAAAALVAAEKMGISAQTAALALAEFPSTKRRFESRGVKAGVSYYDDYAHHPHEVAATIAALKDWYPNSRRIIIFQPHTFSRTKQLLTEFVSSFSQAEELIMTEIFASARESSDPTTSTDLLLSAITQAYPQHQLSNLHTNEQLADYLKTHTNPGDVVITMGAGDIYQVHDLIR